MSKLLRTKPKQFRGLGKNFMTPNVLKYYRVDHNVVELSRGIGFDHEEIFGVTVRPNGDLSKLFRSRSDAEEYIETLA
jgi:hypothetical protein